MKSVSSVVALFAIIVAAGCSAASPSGPGEPVTGAEDEQTESLGTGLQAHGHRGGGMFAEADKDNDGKVTLAEANAVATTKFAAGDENHDGFLDAAELAKMRPGRGPGGRGPQAGPPPWDKNGDGKMSKDEAPPPMQARFDEADTNKDGVLDQQELHAAHQKMGPPGLAQLDKNNDGKISKDEAPGPMQQHFDQLDANKDGFIDQQELQAAHQKMMAHGPQGGPPPLAQLDKNSDGKISKDEAPGPMQQHFDQLDANKDGFIDQQELQAAHARHQPGGPGAGGRLGHLDTDGDGKVSQAEFLATVQQWFQHADANRDGVITREEVRARRPGKPGAKK